MYLCLVSDLVDLKNKSSHYYYLIIQIDQALVKTKEYKNLLYEKKSKFKIKIIYFFII